MSDTENGNHQAVRDILEQLDSGEQSAFLMHVVRSMLSPEVRKEVATEATRALPRRPRRMSLPRQRKPFLPRPRRTSSSMRSEIYLKKTRRTLLVGPSRSSNPKTD